MSNTFQAKTIVFDADGTLMKGENPYMRLAQLLNCHQLLEEKVQDYLDGKLDYMDLVAWQSDLYKKSYMDLYGVRPKAGDFERLLEVPKIRRSVARVMRELTLRGVRIFILSSGIRFLIRELSRAYVPPEAVYANRFVYDISGEFVSIHVEVKGDKVEALQRIVEDHGLEWENLAYVGDNAFDVPVIKYLSDQGGKAFILEDSKSRFGLPWDFDRNSVVNLRSVSEILDYTSGGQRLITDPSWRKLIEGVRVVIVCGLPGTGKTTLATHIEQIGDFIWLNTDQIRVGRGASEKRKYEGAMGKSQRLAIRKKTYQQLLANAMDNIEEGKRVVLDGTFMDEFRDEAVDVLTQKIPANSILMVVLKTNEDLVMKRKQTRFNTIEQRIFKSLYEAWKKDLLMGKYWYPKKGEYEGINYVEVVDGNLMVE